MPRFMMIICDDEAAREALPIEEQLANLRAKGEWFGKLRESGRSLDGHRLAAARTARTVRTGPRASVVDGPYIEAKELIGGYTILDVPDIDAAVELVKTMPGFPCAVEIRPVEDGPEVVARLMAQAAAAR